MDDDNLLIGQIAFHFQHELEEEAELLDYLCLLTAVLIVGSNEDHPWSVQNRGPRRKYLSQTNLLPEGTGDGSVLGLTQV